MYLVKRLIAVPGDHIHLRNGIVIVNGVAQNAAPRATHDQRTTSAIISTIFRQFP